MIGVILNAIAIYKVMEHEGYKIKKNDLILLTAVNCVCAGITLSYIISCGMFYTIPYVLCAFWLSGVAYVDYLTCNVYEIMEYYAAVPVVISVAKILRYDMGQAFSMLLIMLATVAAYHFMARAGLFGEGDSDILAVVCVIYSDTHYNCMFYVLVMCLFLARNIVHIIKNRGRLLEIKAFIPSIYMGYILMLLIFSLF